MAKVWLVSDEHFYHSNILMWENNRGKRPFKSVDHMNRTMIQRHNEVVAKEDMVYHLGDFTFSKNYKEMVSILGKLNGTHILILGNHDLMKPFDYIEMGFQSAHTSLQLEDFVLIHDPAVAGVVKNKIFIHGHTHGLGKMLGDNTYCVCVELHDYYPVDLERIKRELYEPNRREV